MRRARICRRGLLALSASSPVVTRAQTPAAGAAVADDGRGAGDGQARQQEPGRRARAAGPGAHQHRAGLGGAVPGGDRAGEVHPQLQERDARLRRRCSWGSASRRPDAINGGYDITILKQDQFDANISAIMPLIAPAAYPALDAVKKGYGSSEANYEASEDTVLYSVAQAFYAAAISDEVLLVRDSAINVAQATLDNAKTRFAAGTVTKVDVDRAELALVRAEQGELDARYGREQSYRALATLIQVDGPLKAVPPESLPPPGETDLDMALHLRPEFRGLILTEESYDAQQPRLRAGSGRPRCRRSPRRTSATTSASPATTTPGRSGRSSTGRCSTAARGTRSATWRPRRRRRPRRRPPSCTDSIRDDLANNRSLLETRRQGIEGRAAGRRSGGGDARPRALAVRGGDRHPGRSARGAGQPGDRPGVARLGPLRRGHRRSGVAPHRRHLPTALKRAGPSRLAEPRVAVAARG